MFTDIEFMREAIKEAQIAGEKGEVPVGAVIVKDGMIIARAHNMVEELADSSAHAEMLAIREAEKKLGKWLFGLLYLCHARTMLYVCWSPSPISY